MKFFSLKKSAPEVDFREAVVRGIAPDGGLYFPMYVPQLTPGFVFSRTDLQPWETALLCLQPYVGNDIRPERLEAILQEVLDFPFPIVRLSDQIGSLELFHGPTMAFKDVGARFMARCLGSFSEDHTRAVTVLVATSGDTGGAVASGFLGVEGVEVVILYPKGKVSDIQERQLTTLGHNVAALEVEGSFDDCQAMVKKAFVDADYKDKKRLTSANSINVARWLPQMVYFVLACQRLHSGHRRLVFSVPSGNFGNICAGLIAWKMGLPAHHFIAATNINDTVPRFMETGLYEPSPTRPTLSNAMDVSDPSNFDRILHLFGRERFQLSRIFSSSAFDDSDTRNALKELHQTYGYVADPHGAIGYLALKAHLENRPEDSGVFLETAHPVKFRDTVEQALGIELRLPDAVQDLMGREKKSTPIRDYSEFKDYLLA